MPPLILPRFFQVLTLVVALWSRISTPISTANNADAQLIHPILAPSFYFSSHNLGPLPPPPSPSVTSISSIISFRLLFPNSSALSPIISFAAFRSLITFSNTESRVSACSHWDWIWRASSEFSAWVVEREDRSWVSVEAR